MRAPDCLFRRFVRVAEDADAGLVTYRVPDDALSRSRVPRPVLELAADGSVVRGIPGPADARVPHAGRWEETGEDELTLRWDDPVPDTVVEVVSCEAAELVLRVREGSLDQPGG